LEPVSINLGFYSFSNVPIFFVILGSVLAGLIFSYLLQLLRSVSIYFELRGKSKEIKLGQGEVLELTKKIHQLEIENVKLKHTGSEMIDPNAL